MKELVSLLQERGLTISCCESLTGGLFASKLTEVSGVSSVFKGGLVTYWNEAKSRMAHVSEETLQRYGAVSKETAVEMAVNTRQLFQSDLAVSFTGNAGPSVMEGKPAGLVYCALAYHEQVLDFCFQFQMERNQVREAVCLEMCKKIKDFLTEL